MRFAVAAGSLGLCHCGAVLGVIKDARQGLAPLQEQRCCASLTTPARGGGSHGGTRRERYRNALGSARETGACLDAAIALGYVEAIDAGLLDQLDHVRAVLVKNVL